MATIITRQTTAASITPANAGVTNKGAPLTNAELDTNLIQLNYGITSNAAITGGTINVGSLSATYSNITLPTSGGGSVFVIDNTDISTSSNSSTLYRGSDAGGALRHGAAITWGKSGAWTAGGNNYGSYLSFATRGDANDTLERMRITSAGNVGIGTTSPSSKLTVGSLAGNATNSGDLLINQAGSSITSTCGLELKADASAAGFGTRIATIFNGVSSYDMVFLRRNNSATWTESMRIDTSGNVGIGTTAPTAKLEVNVDGTTGSGINCGAFTSSASSTIPSIQSFGSRADSNTTFQGRFGAALRRTDGTAIAATQNIGMYAFGGQWGTDTSYQSAKLLYPASIKGVAEGSFTSATAMPTAITFNTGSTGDVLGSVNLTYGTERMRITEAGGISFGATGTAYGSNGQVLTSAGNAPPTWSPLPISSQWTTTSSDIYYTTGNVGIGTTTPSSYGKFAVVGTAGQLFTVTDSLTGTIFSANDVSGIPSIEVLDTGVVKLAQYSGNVGIGTASPAYKLDVTGTAKISSTLIVGGTPPGAGQVSVVGANAGISLALSDNINSSLYIRHLAGGSLIGTDGGNALRFATGGSTDVQERMRIHAAGGVSIGNTTDPGAGNLSVTGGTVSLTNGTSNLISYNTLGVNPPAFTTRSAGTKIVLYPAISASNSDYAIGIESSTMWFSVDQVSTRQFKWYGGTTLAATLTAGGALTTVSTISDNKGDVRAAPIQTKASAYVLVATDAGQTIYIATGGVTINASILSAGDMVTIVNNSATAQTITAGASVTFRLAGTATTGNRTLSQYGMATFLCVVGGATPTYHCSGAGLS
jgi:hypothetical protein